MKRLGGPMLVLMCTAAFAAVAAADLIPTPKFSDHPIPTTEVRDASALVGPLVDLALLLAALVLATYLACYRRSRRGLLVLSFASLLWFGFWREGCICPVGATQNVALGICDSSYVVPTVAIGFCLLPLAVALYFGRTFCAAVCPLGAVQEMVAVRPVRVPRWLDQTLGLLPYFYLGLAILLAATGTAFVICRYDPFVALFRMNGNPNMLVFGGSLLLLGLVVGRPYCRWLCPYGALLRLLSKFSRRRVSITPSECINCRLCEDACPYGAILPATVAQGADDRARGRRRLAVVLAAAVPLVIVFASMGTLLAGPLSSWHVTVHLAEQVRRAEMGLMPEPTDAVEAFRTSGRPAGELYGAAIDLRGRFIWLGGALGAWVGLVLAGKSVQLAVRRRRDEYQPDRAGCLACGRCFLSCPVEQVRLGLITDVSEVVET